MLAKLDCCGKLEWEVTIGEPILNVPSCKIEFVRSLCDVFRGDEGEEPGDVEEEQGVCTENPSREDTLFLTCRFLVRSILC